MTKKRGQGEGSIYKRKNGTWVAQLRFQGKRLYKYGNTRAEVRDWLQETLNQVQMGLMVVAAKITVHSFLTEWLVGHKNALRPHTFHSYNQISNDYIFPVLGRIKLRELRPDQIQSFYNSLVHDGKSQRTILSVHAVLHKGLNQALKLGLIGRNPAHAVTRPRVKKKEMKTFTVSQSVQFLNSTWTSRYDALYFMAVMTGLREGELLGLKWSDLNWTTNQLQIQRQVQRLPGGGLVFTEPKTDAGKRTVGLSPMTILKLKGHYLIQTYEKLFVGKNWQEHDLIFPTRIGTPSDPSNLYRNYKTILQGTGLPDIRFHDLRHTAATLMLGQKTHPKVVQERFGHSDISVTLNTYSHVLPGIQDEAANEMDKIFSTNNTAFGVSPALPDLSK
jgi:integrase